jgi:hypothetical protein
VQVHVGDKVGVVTQHDVVAEEFVVVCGNENGPDARHCISIETSIQREIVPCGSVTLVAPDIHDAVKVIVNSSSVAAGAIGLLSGHDTEEMIIRIRPSNDIQILPQSCVAKLNDRLAHEATPADAAAAGGGAAMDTD